MISEVVKGTTMSINELMGGYSGNFLSAKHNIRGFAWDVTDAENLLASLNNLAYHGDESLHLGYVTVTALDLTREKKNAIGMLPRNVMLEVHDGQQRLVTIAILLAALRDMIEEHPELLNEDKKLAFELQNIKEAIAPTHACHHTTVLADPADPGTTSRVPRIDMYCRRALARMLKYSATTGGQPTLEPVKKRARISEDDRLEFEEEDSKKVFDVYRF